MHRLKEADWPAGQSLCRCIETDTLFSKIGEGSRLLLGIDASNHTIACYCTLSRLDDIQPTDKTPWIGYVYTYPEYRGQRLMGQLLDEAQRLAAHEGAKAVWISTGHEGLYERYGFICTGCFPDIHGSLSRVYTRTL